MPGRQVLNPAEAKRVGVNAKYFGDISDTVFLTSRGGNHYQRTFLESFVRPGIGLENWVSRTNYSALGIVPTGNSEMSIYIQKNEKSEQFFKDYFELMTSKSNFCIL